MSDVSKRLEAIGKKLPLELLDECLKLHGDMIFHVHKTTQEDWDAIVEDLRYFVQSTGNMFEDYSITDFKTLLNYKVQQGIETVGKHSDLLVHLKKESVKKDLAKPVVPKEETKQCPACAIPKPLDQFREVKKGHYSSKCVTCLTEQAEKRGDLKPEVKEEPEESELEKLRRNNAELSQKLSHFENQEEMMTEEEWLEKQEGGKGHYFMSAILKCPATNQLHNFIDQVYAISEENAIGQFMLHKEVKNQIIISISYEKSIRDQDVQSDESS